MRKSHYSYVPNRLFCKRVACSCVYGDSVKMALDSVSASKFPATEPHRNLAGTFVEPSRNATKRYQKVSW